MATYEEIYGKRVKELSADPTLDSSYEGQVWYNSTTGTLKTLISFGSWNSRGNVSTNRIRGGGCGIVTAGLAFGGYGYSPAPVANNSATEEFGGFVWTSGGALGTAKSSNAGAGTQTAGLSCGGVTTVLLNQTEEYDGSSWTAGNAYPISKHSMGAAGTQTAGLCFGGTDPATTVTTNEYDGTSWTSGGDLATGRSNLGSAGTQTAGLAFGGNPGAFAGTEEYNGSTWSEGGSLNTARLSLGSAGTQTSALAFGGSTPSPGTGATEAYDGSTWSNANKGLLANPRYDNTISFGASATSAISGPGANPEVTTTEEFQVSINTITPAAWASTPSLGTARRQVGGFGHTTTTAVCVCGQNPPALSNVEEYNGSSWSEVTNMPVARVKPFASGTLTAGLAGGGESGPTPTSAPSAAEYDGTNWTATPAIPQAATDSTSFGLQTATVMCIGVPSPTTAVFDYDGSTWTAGNATPIQMASSSGNGVETAGLVYTGAALSTSESLAYNGSSWTSAGALIAARSRSAEAVGAPSTAALFFAGNNPTSTTKAETFNYDGTSWSTRPNMATARRGLGGAGINTASLAFAGYTGTADTAVSEEFTGDVATITARTLTSS